MTNPLLDELREPRHILEKLTPGESEHLLGLIHAARIAQQRSLDTALDTAIGALPRLLRLPARTILFGK